MRNRNESRMARASLFVKLELSARRAALEAGGAAASAKLV
jgi:hypothetical protein